MQKIIFKGGLLISLVTFINFWLQPKEVNPIPQLMVEQCANALDDDGDGLIDLNDPDCECPPPKPTSIIPNPSFEVQDCCPGNNSQMYCSSNWIQASVPTTDYVHTCGWVGWPDYPAPQPFPDGEACLGFRNGRVTTDGLSFQPNWKEYAGICLRRPLKVGTYYRIEFYLGFSLSRYSPTTQVAFFGASSCEDLPFNESDAGFGCPSNSLRWTELAKVRVSGNNGWTKAAVEFTPNRDVEALVIGPDCSPAQSRDPIYYFIDDLILAEEELFDIYTIQEGGNPCVGAAILEVPEADTLTYQWYRDGIALLGETGPQLSNVSQEGFYRVRLQSPSACSLTEPYYFNVPFTFNKASYNICPGETFAFKDQDLSQAGIYVDTLKTVNQCDSIVELELVMDDQKVDTVAQKIFESETWTAPGYSFDRPGEYILEYTSEFNCDSLVLLQLDYYDVFVPTAFSPNGDGVNDLFMLYGTQDLTAIESLQIFDRWGNTVFAANNFLPGDTAGAWDSSTKKGPAPVGTYIYAASVTFDDGKTRLISGSFTLTR